MNKLQIGVHYKKMQNNYKEKNTKLTQKTYNITVYNKVIEYLQLVFKLFDEFPFSICMDVGFFHHYLNNNNHLILNKSHIPLSIYRLLLSISGTVFKTISSTELRDFLGKLQIHLS